MLSLCGHIVQASRNIRPAPSGKLRPCFISTKTVLWDKYITQRIEASDAVAGVEVVFAVDSVRASRGPAARARPIAQRRRAEGL